MEHRENYHGLIKQGTTCYLNSVLQVLFMTPEFRQAVTRSVEEDPNSDFIDSHLKEMFDLLLEKTTDTCKILTTLHIDKVFEQQDAAEYLEKILKQTSPSAAKIFHGQMVHRTTCSVCQKETSAVGPFWHLPLELSENYSVENGLQEFFKASDISGENLMYCEPCNTKVNSSTKYVMKHHPDVLVLLLKRFDFSHQSRSYVKICCDVDVSYTLTIPQDQTYELYAVVDHFGNLRGGHYTATIKSQDDERWFTFDGDRVTPLGWNPFPDNKNIAKFSGAYLLFYRKKDSGLYSVDEHTSEDLSSTKDADLQPADAERNTNIKTKRKELVKDGRQERWDSTTGESKIKKLKQEKKPTKRNKSKEKTSQTEKESMNDSDSDQSESDDPHSQRRKPLNKKTNCDEGLVGQELRNVNQNVRQKDKKKRLIRSKNLKTDEDPDVSASERRERPTGNQAAESREEKKKKTIQTNTNRGLEEAADRGHVSEKAKLKVKKITETKKVIHTDHINRKQLIVKTVDEEFFFIEEDRDNRNTDHKSDLNTANISFPTCSVDQSESLQSDVSGLKDYRGVKLEVPDRNSQKKKTFLDKLREVPEKLQTRLRGNV